ncbi:acyltransferase family protein [Phyllobacterium sp. CCNWLW109]|uniref:acyltransferase family protein n=1 Tax=Phyllobacterium sp. CCNWLW109 TaxID=3127479 RepID=UPI00307757B4
MQAFRTDIHGLRAVAVLLVVLFHIHEPMIPGGFVGVDIFFVISGYVITRGIAKDYASGTFSYSEFYRRRFRRIFPVMFFVTAITLITGAFVLLPEDYIALSWSAIFAAFSSSNIYFTYFLDTSYFAADSRLTPLLHLWSLGVEEQFYIVWPALLLILLKWQRFLIPAIAALIVASVLVGQVLLDKDQFSFAYYMLPSRIFQLATGGLMVFLIGTEIAKSISERAALVLGLFGMSLVVGSAWLTNPTAFPGFNAVPVTFGVALIILSGVRETVLYKALSARPAQFFGDISYSLYLWHWPVLAFMRYSYIDINLVNGVLAFVAMAVLSAASYWLIENPFRHTKQPFRTVLSRMFLLPASALSVACLAVIGWGGIVPAFTPVGYASQLGKLADQTKPAYQYDYVCQKTQLTASDVVRPSCIINSIIEPTVLLWGDSNAAHYIGVLGELGQQQGFSFRNIEHSSCAPLLVESWQFSSGIYRKACKESVPIVEAIIDQYDTIIIAAAWGAYHNFSPEFQDKLRGTLVTLTGKNKKILLIGQVVAFQTYDRKCAGKALKIAVNCADRFSRAAVAASPVNGKLKQLADEIDNVKYIDFNDAICPLGICSPYSEEVPLYFDGGHLSMMGSWIVGKRAAKMAGYRDLLLE